MTDRVAPKMIKWPFYLGDLALLAVAGWVVQYSSHPVQLWQVLVVISCVAAGAWLAITPFQEEYRVRAKLAESEQLTTVADQIRNFQGVGEQVMLATAQWQVVQEHCAKAVMAAGKVEEKMAGEMKDFTEFLAKANDSEKAHLRLEVDKLRRSEREWLQILVHLLDQVYALHQAGAQTGQTGLIDQLTLFQNACRDIVRRVGLTPFAAEADQLFDPEVHQLADAASMLNEHSRISHTVATGYNFQGQLIRPALVALKAIEPLEPELEEPAQLTLESTGPS
jgi:molecular chaperone GrpE (heat shock protein)